MKDEAGSDPSFRWGDVPCRCPSRQTCHASALKPRRFASMCAGNHGPRGQPAFREISMSSLFTFLLVVQAVIAAAMIGVILMQKSEGGGLGVGGSPAGLLSARGAADFLTRATTVLATLFVGLSIVLAAMASVRSGERRVGYGGDRTV